MQFAGSRKNVRLGYLISVQKPSVANEAKTKIGEKSFFRTSSSPPSSCPSICSSTFCGSSIFDALPVPSSFVYLITKTWATKVSLEITRRKKTENKKVG